VRPPAFATLRLDPDDVGVKSFWPRRRLDPTRRRRRHAVRSNSRMRAASTRRRTTIRTRRCPASSSALADLAHEDLGDPVGLNVPISSQSERSTSVPECRGAPPELIAERLRDLEARSGRVVVEVDEDGHVRLVRVAGELPRGRHRVAP
jgi:hypothetical protein